MSDQDITETIINRSIKLNCPIVKGNPKSEITIYPSVVVSSAFIDDVIFPDDQEQVTLDQIQTAEQNAIIAEQNAIATEKENLDSAKSKLVSLGLTADEITALLGKNN